MNPLHRNDRPATYPASWYAATATLSAERPALAGDEMADVAILGAGFTGLWAAKVLAEKGFKVVLLEAHRVGWGASGRNGGQVGSGYNKPMRWIAGRMGADKARMVWQVAEDAKSQLRAFCESHAVEADWKAGVAHGAYSDAEAEEDKAEVDFLAREYGYEQSEAMGADRFRELVKSPLYHGGVLDRGAAHIHPLNYALALARAAEAAGATIHERSEVTAIESGASPSLTTAAGTLRAKHLILAGNGYLPAIEPHMSARVMPINSFIAATRPLEDPRSVLAEEIAVADSKFVVNYYRFTSDGRFLFGGRESYGLGFPTDIRGPLVARMTNLFPQLKGVEVEHVWGGTLGITMTRLPHLARLGPTTLSAAGFSGHGVALSGMAGRLMGEAVAGQAERFDVMSELPVQRFPGGATFRTPLMTLAMSWYALRDRLGV
ncbi:NAD(P)/FAD-dependent oxidoreductase [Pseudoroseicyclus tamaricis]|uniref:FAD-binding oxidoreductase n=1 Tax=Pseudoroseicyclus tamaricis TaxID=2705421 RepID=A0A6B2JTT5_9RHOB|nr:FAD-binding oxidoreductase [Pseudoroseicyclus tamaricis]NDV01698.1 FAD-binding oxidoreductase [Pseudoroseicyclus tamaricis]